MPKRAVRGSIEGWGFFIKEGAIFAEGGSGDGAIF